MANVNQTYPSQNPAEGGIAGSLKRVFDKLQQDSDGCLPATVISYDRVRNVATVKPVVQIIGADGSTVSRAHVASVPVLALGSGQFFINFPLKPGDLGWIYASDRDISLFKQGLSEARPNTLRKKSFEDGLFVPDIFRSYSIDSEDLDDNLVMQHKDGKVRVAVWLDRVKITCQETMLTIFDNGEVHCVAPQKVLFDTPLVEFTGTFKAGTGGTYGTGGGMSHINGGLHSTKEMKSDTDMQAQSVSLYNHTHKGVEPGGGATQAPVK